MLLFLTSIVATIKPARLALFIAGIPFEDERISFEDFPAVKKSGRLPFGQVPLLTVDGKVFAQSGACVRYCARIAGLFPVEDLLAFCAIEEIAGVIDDLYSSIFSYRGKDRDELKASRRNTAETVFPRLLGGLEKITREREQSATLGLLESP